MLAIIMVGTIVLYLALIGFVLHNLEGLSPKLKIVYILVGIFVMGIVTLIVFNISASGVDYQNKDMIANVRNVIVLVFTPINAFIVMPFIANLVNKLSMEEITESKVKKGVIISIIVLIVILIFECGYFTDIQSGVLEMLNKIK